MRPWIVGMSALLAASACKQPAPESSSSDESSPPQEPSSTTPVEPVNVGATDFCKLIYEAPQRKLDRGCTDADKKTDRYKAVLSETRKRVQDCWTMLSAGVRKRRVTLPATAAKRCAEALEQLPWEQAMRRTIDTVAECRNIAVGLSLPGKPCRASVECSPGNFCSGATTSDDGLCMKKVAAGDSCQKSEWEVLGESEVSCDAGLFCDHGVVPSRDPLDAPAGSTSRRSPRPLGKAEVSGRLPPEVIQRIVRANFKSLRSCYDKALKRDSTLQGRVLVRFVIGRDGSVTAVSAGSDIPDEEVKECVTKVFYTLRFPQPEGGIVTVSYPIEFLPDDGAPTERASAFSTTCTAARKQGEGCRATRECAADLGCVKGQCGKRLGAGAKCDGSRDCETGLRCYVQPVPPDEAAEEDAADIPKPVIGQCTKPKSVDAACESDRDCVGACVAKKCALFCGSG